MVRVGDLTVDCYTFNKIMLLFTGTYHYHQNPNCLSGTEVDEFIGVARDGFPIYGNKVIMTSEQWCWPSENTTTNAFGKLVLRPHA